MLVECVQSIGTYCLGGKMLEYYCRHVGCYTLGFILLNMHPLNTAYTLGLPLVYFVMHVF